MTRIPDICDEVASKSYFAHHEAEKKLDQPGDDHNPFIDMLPKSKNVSVNGLYNLYSAYSHWIIVGIVVILMLNVLICGYVKCSKRKVKKSGGRRYGKVSKDLESEDSDGTDSEIDSDDSSIEQLIE